MRSVPPEKLTPTMSLHGELNLQVLDTLQVVLDLEDEWPGIVYFPDEEAEAVQTVGDLEGAVLRKIANPEQEAP